MAQPRLSPAKRAAFEETLYREKIRPILPEADIGKLVVIDVNSGDYVVEDNEAQTVHRLNERPSDAFTYLLRYDYPLI